MSVSTIWTVYDHPSDFPQSFVARLFLNGKATETCLVNADPWFIRVVIMQNYPLLRCLPRNPLDDPCITEVWM